MKTIFKRFLLLGMSLTVVALVATQSWDTAESDSSTEPDPDPGSKISLTPASQSADLRPAEPRFPTALGSMPGSGDAAIAFHPLAGTTVTFSGTVIRAGSRFALRETAGVLYTLDSAGRAWPFEGEHVRVTGKLDTTTRLLHIDEIQSRVA